MKKYAVIVGTILAAVVLLAGTAGAEHPFEHGIVLDVDYVDYYLAGPADGPGGAKDVPGHEWHQISPNEVIGWHYNTGPSGMAKWWSSDAEDGALLFVVSGVIDTWSLDKAAWYYSKGYVHYHELVSVKDGTLHPTKVVWLRHVAVTSFNFDAGPMPQMGHQVTPGVDYVFMPNWTMPYVGEAH